MQLLLKCMDLRSQSSHFLLILCPALRLCSFFVLLYIALFIFMIIPLQLKSSLGILEFLQQPILNLCLLSQSDLLNFSDLILQVTIFIISLL